jgi:hypothetical protein
MSKSESCTSAPPCTALPALLIRNSEEQLTTSMVLQKPTGTQLPNKFPRWKTITVFATVPPPPVIPIHIPMPYLFNTIFTWSWNLCLRIPRDTFTTFRFSEWHWIQISYLSYAYCVPHKAGLYRSDHTNNVSRSVQISNVPINKFQIFS